MADETQAEADARRIRTAHRYMEWYETKPTEIDPDTTPIEESGERLMRLWQRMYRVDREARERREARGETN